MAAFLNMLKEEPKLAARVRWMMRMWFCDALYCSTQGSTCLAHPGVRDKHRVSEIDLSRTPGCPRQAPGVWDLYGLTLNGWHAVLCITNNRHEVTIATHAIKRHFLIWVTTSRQPTKRRCSCVLTLKYTFICVYWWTRQRIQNTLIAGIENQWGIKRFQTRRSLVWNRFIPHSSQVSIYHIKV